jgi:DNA-binding response OmpR family regulator
MEVAVMRWPSQSARRAELGERPVLWLVEADHPPERISVLEDWVRLPSSDADIAVRVESLRRRSLQMAQLAPAWPSAPYLDDSGILHHGSAWVSLSPLETRLAAVLLARLGAVVTRQALTEAGWPERGGHKADPRRNVLDAHILRLRHRLPAVGLTIRTVRSRGYLLEVVSDLSETRHQVDSNS